MTFSPATIYWIRHAPTASGGVYVGQADVACIPPTRCEFEEAQGLREIATWHSSDLSRARDTARWLMNYLGIPQHGLKEHSALREQHFGAWEGAQYESIYTTHPDIDWNNPAHITPPGGENFVDVCARVGDWLNDYLGHMPPAKSAVVAHAGVIRAALAHALSLNAIQGLHFQMDAGSISSVTYHAPRTGAGTLECLNRRLLG